jgi:hypothetical protein
MAGEAMPVHRMSAKNRVAVMAAHDPRSAGSTVEGSPDRAHALGADVERAVRFYLAFLEALTSGMILDVQVDLNFRMARRSR